MFVHHCFLTGILIFAISPQLVISHIRDYGFWTNNAKKFVYSCKDHYETHFAPGSPLPKGYKMDYTRPNPWLLLGQSCDVADWTDYISHFVLEGEDPKVYFDQLKTYPGYPGTLAKLCLNVDSFPSLRCEPPIPGATTGTGICKCFQHPDPRFKHTPYSYLPDPMDPTACVAEEGSICDLQGTIKCNKPEFLSCNKYDNVCGSDSILYTQALLHSLGGVSPDVIATASGLITLSQVETAYFMVDEILEVAQHPVNIGQNGCNLKQFRDVTSEVVGLMEALTKEPPEFQNAHAAFMRPIPGIPGMTGLVRSQVQFDLVKDIAESPSGSLGGPTPAEIRVARLTKLCIDNFPATRCLDTKSAEANQSLTATPESSRYMLDGDCVCADDEKTPLFRYETKELTPEAGKARSQCLAKPNSSCDTISGPVPCAVHRPDPDQEVTYECSPRNLKADDFRGGIPYIYKPFELWICQNLDNQPETEEEILKKMNENSGSRKLTFAKMVPSLLFSVFRFAFV